MKRREQLEQLLMNSKKGQLMSTLLEEDNWAFLCSLSSYIEDMLNYDQMSPYHCFDLLEHTCVTVENVLSSDVSEDEYRLLKVAAFFHDIGKPVVMKEKVNQYNEKRHVYYGHPEASIRIAKPILMDLGYDSYELNRILVYIGAHDSFIQLRMKDECYVNGQKTGVIDVKTVKRIEDRFIHRHQDLNPTYHDFTVMINLCYGDAVAHVDKIYNHDGEVIDTCNDRVRRIKALKKVCKTIEEESKTH